MAAIPDWPEVAVVSHWGFIRALTGVELSNCQTVRCDPTAPHPTLGIDRAGGCATE
jgi:hypothetical protein